MRQRIAVTIASFALALALLINFRGPEAVALTGSVTPGSNGGTNGSTTSGTGSSGGSTGTSTGQGTSGSTPTATAAPAANGTSGTFTGPLAANPYGDVQVQITVQGGKIVDVKALSLPTGGHSGRISNYVEPILRSQALAAQSARINGVSGASYTSQAYAQSLQGALDQAGL